MVTVRKTKKQIAEEAKRYFENVDKTNVRFSDLKPGMIIVRPTGARYEINSVGIDSKGIFADKLKTWAASGLSVDGAMCYKSTRIDDWGLPGADVEKMCSNVLTIVRPDAANGLVWVETATIR